MVEKKKEKKKVKQQELGGMPSRGQLAIYCDEYLEQQKNVKSENERLKLIRSNILREMNGHKPKLRIVRHGKKVFTSTDEQKLKVSKA